MKRLSLAKSEVWEDKPSKQTSVARIIAINGFTKLTALMGSTHAAQSTLYGHVPMYKLVAITRLSSPDTQSYRLSLPADRKTRQRMG